MTADEIKEFEEGLRWESERNRRLALKRRRMLAAHEEMIVNIIIIVMALITCAIILYIHVTQEKRERAAYLEGYHGVSHAVAMQMAESEVR